MGKVGAPLQLGHPHKKSLTSSEYTQGLVPQEGQSVNARQPHLEAKAVTADEYMAKLKANGFTVHKRTKAYLVLQGPDGISGTPCPYSMTPEEREEQYEMFVRRNLLS